MERVITMRGMGYSDFIEPGYKPNARELVVVFRLENEPWADFERTAGGLAAESSIGTWDPHLSTMSEEARKYGARVFELDKESGIVKIAYGPDLFEAGNMPQILSSVTGNVYGLKEVKHLRVEDTIFPEGLAKSFPGPQVGLAGMRKITGVKHRPLFGTIVKPKLGLSAERWAEAAYDAWVGGLDIVKDDENLTSMTFNHHEKRWSLVVKAKNKAERETGEKKIYFANITAPVTEMFRRADFLRDLGNEYVMYDILTGGWGGLQALREHLDGRNTGIHAHRAQHGAVTRTPFHGISMLAICRWARLCGVDNLHAGTAGAGKMEGDVEESLAYYHALRNDWYVKPVAPVASGGLHPGVVPMLVDRLGTDFAATFGGGVHGHPDGSRAGAMAVRQALEASLAGTPLPEAAKKHPELATALKKWGMKPPSGGE